jgi:hypothetical protein
MRAAWHIIPRVVLRFFDQKEASLAQNLVFLFAGDAVAFSGSDHPFVFFLVIFIFGRGKPFFENSVEISFDLIVVFVFVFVFGNWTGSSRIFGIFLVLLLALW